MDSNDKWYTYNQDNGLYIGYEIESQYYQNSSSNNYIWYNNNYDRYMGEYNDTKYWWTYNFVAPTFAETYNRLVDLDSQTHSYALPNPKMSFIQYETQAEFSYVAGRENIGTAMWIGLVKERDLSGNIINYRWLGPQDKPILLGHYNGHSYFFIRQLKTSDDHTTYANNLGAYLFNPNFSGEFSFIQEKLLETENWSVPININSWNTSDAKFMDQAFVGIQYNSEGYSTYKLSEFDQTSQDAQLNFDYGIGSLAPGQTITLVFSKTILDSEMDLGGYSNSLTVTANNGVSQVSDDPNTTEEDDPTVVNFDVVKELEVIKTAVVIDTDPSENTFNSVNDTIHYTIEVKNTGTVPLYGLTLTDNLTTRGTFDPADPTLEFQNKSVPASESLASIWGPYTDEPDNTSTSANMLHILGMIRDFIFMMVQLIIIKNI